VTGEHSTLLAVTPHYPTVKCLLGAEVVEVLEEAYDDRRLPGTARSTHDKRECIPKFQIITHAWSGGENAPLPRNAPYLYPKGTDELSPKRGRLKNEMRYILSSGSVIMASVPPPYLLRLMFFSVCTVTVGSPDPRIIALMTSKFTNFLAFVI